MQPSGTTNIRTLLSTSCPVPAWHVLVFSFARFASACWNVAARRLFYSTLSGLSSEQKSCPLTFRQRNIWPLWEGGAGGEDFKKNHLTSHLQYVLDFICKISWMCSADGGFMPNSWMRAKINTYFHNGPPHWCWLVEKVLVLPKLRKCFSCVMGVNCVFVLCLKQDHPINPFEFPPKAL